MEGCHRLQEAARIVARKTRQAAPPNAHELVDLFEQAGFFQAIEYGSIEEDGRLEQQSTEEHVDILLRSFTGCLLALLAIAPSDTPIAEAFPQLAQHAQDRPGQLPDTLALTNGNELWLFQVADGQLPQTHWEFNLSDLSVEQAQILRRCLSQYPIDWGRQVRAPHL